MASIVKRKNKWAVVYTCTDENGVKRQKWESFGTNADAKKRKAQVEFQLANGNFIVPSAKTLSDLLEEYVSIYGINEWAASTYENKRGLIDNYINPILGDTKLDDITTRMMNTFYQKMLSVKTKSTKYHRPSTEFVTVKTVRNIHKLLRNAFNLAVKWELMAKNPVLNCTLPKATEQERNIWSREELAYALEKCEDDLLALALNLAFAGSLRIGEMLGLTWDCVDVSETSIRAKRPYIFINKELQRVNKQAIEALNRRDIIYVFPAVMAKNNTSLVLKTPKTRTSVRRVYLPVTVAEMLLERKKQIEDYKEYFGDEYIDYNLVFCNNFGRPIEGQVINKALNDLIRKHNLPKVVFHSIRHTSTTYKLKLTGGDIKAVQGDTGHAQAGMITDRYAHIMDEDRRVNAERMDADFYGNGEVQPIPAQPAQPIQEPERDADKECMAIFNFLKQSPEMMAMLKQMALQTA